MVHPLEIAVTLTWILGIWFIIGAIFQGVGAFSSTRTRPRWMLLIAAVLSLIIGILFVAQPGVGVLSIVIWIARRRDRLGRRARHHRVHGPQPGQGDRRGGGPAGLTPNQPGRRAGAPGCGA